ncbi:hypothetical protein F5H01DRAFT_358564 [Linnemannia elongata]|nr:hypothetical protein F5H01DRAFT_358564 [Linnemannia elongata]
MLHRIAILLVLMLSFEIIKAGSIPVDSWDYGSYGKCVSANGGPSFKRYCNSCFCLRDGRVACTKMSCPKPSKF